MDTAQAERKTIMTKFEMEKIIKGLQEELHDTRQSRDTFEGALALRDKDIDHLRNTICNMKGEYDHAVWGWNSVLEANAELEEKHAKELESLNNDLNAARDACRS
jgi:hypothetical protein